MESIASDISCGVMSLRYMISLSILPYGSRSFWTRNHCQVSVWSSRVHHDKELSFHNRSVHTCDGSHCLHRDEVQFGFSCVNSFFEWIKNFLWARRESNPQSRREIRFTLATPYVSLLGATTNGMPNYRPTHERYTDSHVARVYQTRHNTQVAINPDTSL